MKVPHSIMVPLNADPVMKLRVSKLHFVDKVKRYKLVLRLIYSVETSQRNEFDHRAMYSVPNLNLSKKSWSDAKTGARGLYEVF